VEGRHRQPVWVKHQHELRAVVTVGWWKTLRASPLVLLLVVASLQSDLGFGGAGVVLAQSARVALIVTLAP
jgi:hypothetical protein